MIHTDKADTADLIAVLNDLAETCKDGEKGFRTAALAVPNSELASLFLNYSEQRAEFADELLAEVRRLGGDPEDRGTAIGTLHRGWIGLKAAVEGKDEGGIIAEAERGEDHAVKKYREALEKDLPTPVRTIVEHHYIHVRDAHDHVRAMEQLVQGKAAEPRGEPA